jgi:hypothetical protein
LLDVVFDETGFARLFMTNSLLQRFLDAGLFDIGDDDERLKIFQASATDLAKEIAEKPEKAICATLVAIDPAASDNDPVLEEAETAVKKHWQAFKNKYAERPKGLLRPVLLEALQAASADSPAIAAAIWYSGVSLLPFLEPHKERALVKEVFESMGTATEREAEKLWAPGAFDAELNLPKFSVKFGEHTNGKVDRKALEQGMTDAVGPQNQSGQAGKDPNQHWPNANHNWAYQFAPRAASAVASAVEKAIAPLAGQAAVISEQLEPALKKFGKEVNAGVTNWVGAAVGSIRQRSELIWWKETLYSPTLRRSYRGLTPAEIAVTMAQDLHAIAPAPCPQSVEYFLRETLCASCPENPELSFAEILDAANRSNDLSKILVPAKQVIAPRRTSLLSTLSISRHTALKMDTLPACLGVRGDSKLPASELAVWLFRDAQALSLISDQSEK